MFYRPFTRLVALLWCVVFYTLHKILFKDLFFFSLFFISHVHYMLQIMLTFLSQSWKILSDLDSSTLQQVQNCVFYAKKLLFRQKCFSNIMKPPMQSKHVSGISVGPFCSSSLCSASCQPFCSFSTLSFFPLGSLCGGRGCQKFAFTLGLSHQLYPNLMYI